MWIRSSHVCTQVNMCIRASSYSALVLLRLWQVENFQWVQVDFLYYIYYFFKFIRLRDMAKTHLFEGFLNKLYMHIPYIYVSAFFSWKEKVFWSFDINNWLNKFIFEPDSQRKDFSLILFYSDKVHYVMRNISVFHILKWKLVNEEFHVRLQRNRSFIQQFFWDFCPTNVSRNLVRITFSSFLSFYFCYFLNCLCNFLSVKITALLFHQQFVSKLFRKEQPVSFN